MTKWKTIKIRNLKHTNTHRPYLKNFFFQNNDRGGPLASKHCRVTWIFRISPWLPCLLFNLISQHVRFFYHESTILMLFGLLVLEAGWISIFAYPVEFLPWEIHKCCFLLLLTLNELPEGNDRKFLLTLLWTLDVMLEGGGADLLQSLLFSLQRCKVLNKPAESSSFKVDPSPLLTTPKEIRKNI